MTDPARPPVKSRFPVLWCASAGAWDAFSDVDGAVPAVGLDPFGVAARDQLRSALASRGPGVLVLAEGRTISAESLGPFAVVRDQINVSGKNPLFGPNTPEVGPRFPDMTTAYDGDYQKRLESAVGLVPIVVAELPPGGQPDTHDIERVRALGAQAISNGLVAPVITARHAGARIAALLRLNKDADWNAARDWLLD